MGFVFVAISVILIAFFAVRQRRRDEAAREKRFRVMMLALEEKAKNEGTFVLSYFDGEKK